MFLSQISCFLTLSLISFGYFYSVFSAFNQFFPLLVIFGSNFTTFDHFSAIFGAFFDILGWVKPARAVDDSLTACQHPSCV